MMGMKERHVAPLINVSLEEFVPHDHFYRHVERTLDLSFVRELVQQTYAAIGRPSIDPVVFWHRCNWSCLLRGYAQNGNCCGRRLIGSAFCGTLATTWVSRCPTIPV